MNKSYWPPKDEVEHFRWTNNHSEYHSFGYGFCEAQDSCELCDYRIRALWRPHYFCGEIGEPVVCYFDGQNTWHDSYGVDFERILNPDDVTHWMPLPEPPKEEWTE